jgi:hypothetical protein
MVTRWYIFTPKSKFKSILQGFAMEGVCIFITFLSVLWPFGIFFRFGMLYQEKSRNPAVLDRQGDLIGECPEFINIFGNKLAI